MADNSKIEWTDATWNVITGCSIESPGCKNCYAMKLAGTRLRNHPSRAGLTKDSAAGPVWTGETRFNEQWLPQPLQWRRPRRIFVCAHGDLFHESVPDEWIAAVFGVMAAAQHHVFQVLTKRADRMARFVAAMDGPDLQHEACAVLDRIGFERGCGSAFDASEWPLRNVWLGASVERQQEANERRPHLEAAASAGWLTWASYEPALGPIDWAGWEFLRWLVGGGESGANARPSHPDWHRAARDFAAAHGIAYLFKQWGEWLPWNHFCDARIDDPPEQTRFDTREFDDGEWRDVGRPDYWATIDGDIDDQQCVGRVGKKAAGRLLDGIKHDGFPS